MATVVGFMPTVVGVGAMATRQVRPRSGAPDARRDAHWSAMDTPAGQSPDPTQRFTSRVDAYLPGSIEARDRPASEMDPGALV